MFNLNKKSYKPIIVFGVARSGSTWLSQIISSAGYELNFEGIATMNYPPDYHLNCKAVPPYYYLKKEDNNPYKEFMDILINCQIRNSAVVKSNKGMPKKLSN
jgi:hypothetical protein